MKAIVHAVEEIPGANALLAFLRRTRHRRRLNAVDVAPASTAHLRYTSSAEIGDFIACDRSDCITLDGVLEQVATVRGPGAVNPGDRFALAHIVLRLRPGRILEIGTHAAASTISMAIALSFAEPGTIDTVDIIDVNDPDQRRAAGLDPEPSPEQILNRLGLQDRVRFFTCDGLTHLRATNSKYDLIFLDGDHSAVTVYREIPAALDRLAPGGVVVLHDYFPGGRPIWPFGRVEVGPWLAIRRLEREGTNITAIPVGTLPWPTRLKSHLTSLAILSRRPRH